MLFLGPNAHQHKTKELSHSLRSIYCAVTKQSQLIVPLALVKTRQIWIVMSCGQIFISKFFRRIALVKHEAEIWFMTCLKVTKSTILWEFSWTNNCSCLYWLINICQGSYLLRLTCWLRHSPMVSLSPHARVRGIY